MVEGTRSYLDFNACQGTLRPIFAHVRWCTPDPVQYVPDRHTRHVAEVVAPADGPPAIKMETMATGSNAASWARTSWQTSQGPQLTTWAVPPPSAHVHASRDAQPWALFCLNVPTNLARADRSFVKPEFTDKQHESNSGLDLMSRCPWAGWHTDKLHG